VTSASHELRAGGTPRIERLAERRDIHALRPNRHLPRDDRIGTKITIAPAMVSHAHAIPIREVELERDGCVADAVHALSVWRYRLKPVLGHLA
jgi:hypothetical protein